MRPGDAELKIKECAAGLDAALTLAKFREFTRGGLPSGGGDGRGGEPALPLLGGVDRRIQSARLEYESNLRHAALALETCLRIQFAWCVPLDTDSEKAKKLKDAKTDGVPCANVACDRWMTGAQDSRPRHIDGVALCERCYRSQKRTGKRWTPQQDAAEVAPTVTARR